MMDEEKNDGKSNFRLLPPGRPAGSTARQDAEVGLKKVATLLLRSERKHSPAAGHVLQYERAGQAGPQTLNPENVQLASKP